MSNGRPLLRWRTPSKPGWRVLRAPPPVSLSGSPRGLCGWGTHFLRDQRSRARSAAGGSSTSPSPGRFLWLRFRDATLAPEGLMKEGGELPLSPAAPAVGFSTARKPPPPPALPQTSSRVLTQIGKTALSGDAEWRGPYNKRALDGARRRGRTRHLVGLAGAARPWPAATCWPGRGVKGLGRMTSQVYPGPGSTCV